MNKQNNKIKNEKDSPKDILVKVDGEDVESESRTVTANELIKSSGITNTTGYYLILIKGGPEKEYEGDQDIKLHPNMEFTTGFHGSTPVS